MIAQQTTDKVYSGAVTFESNGWCSISLDTPFEYDGTSNLLLTVDDNTGSSGTYAKFYTFSSTNYMAVYKGSFSDINPASPPSGEKTKNRNQIKLIKAIPGYLSLSSDDLSGFTYSVGEGPSEAQGVAIIGANLQDDLTVTAPTGFEVSETLSGTYTNTVTLSPSEGSLQTMVYVRLAAGLDEGTFSGTMVIASGNASASVNLSGEVNTGTSPQPYTFTGAAGTSWNEASNWLGNEVPDEGASVIIDGICELDVDANVASLTVNEGKSITVLAGKALTAEAITTIDASQLVVADGGQLLGNVGGVLATVKREIVGFGSDNSVTDGWNFIASPLEGSVSPTEVDNMITETTYDLYYFKQDTELEWQNYKAHTDNFTIASGQGYLYANSDDVTLNFAGQLNSSVTSVELIYESGYDFSGWNLIGNPFTYDAYIDKPHYVMGEGILNPNPVMASIPIAPCTGVMVKVDAQETLAFSQTPSDRNEQGSLHMMLSQSNRRGVVSDHVILSFNEGDELAKYHFGNNAMLYFPKDGKDFAIMTAEACGEVPVCFKANENGTYRLDFSAEDVAFGYLHLIDNMTGADVDLLAPELVEGPASYSFEAKTTDYANRFKLVFATGLASDDNFAFMSNGGWVISNDGQATLQVVEVTGRLLSSETINGCCIKNLTVASGVYMLRLINGNSVKTQKIIVD